MKIAATGHRPNKLGKEYGLKGPYSFYIKTELQKYINIYKPDTIISGMALGVDSIFALLAIENNLDLIAAIPCVGQEKKWPQSSQNLYNDILKYDKCTKIVLANHYTLQCMQNRNIYMVDNCDRLIAVWDGTNGGTKNCINYAKSTNKPIDYIKINHGILNEQSN